MNRFFVLSAALMLVGCASVGRNFDFATISSLRPGMPEAQVIAMLGEPTSRTMFADGSEQLMWVYSHANAFGSAQAKAAMLKFGPDRRYVGMLNTTQTNIH